MLVQYRVYNIVRSSNLKIVSESFTTETWLTDEKALAMAIAKRDRMNEHPSIKDSGDLYRIIRCHRQKKVNQL